MALESVDKELKIFWIGRAHAQNYKPELTKALIATWIFNTEKIRQLNFTTSLG